MNGQIPSIDTDAGIGTILSHFDSEYISHVIDDSLQMKFRPFDGPMPNIVDVLDRQFRAIYSNSSPDYYDKINMVRNETYMEIINKICGFYNLTFDISEIDITDQELYGIARLMYEIFISRFTEYMIDFFVKYIIDNVDAISSYLKLDETSIKPKEVGLYASKNFIDQKFIIVHANINKVIYNMVAYDIPLQTLLNYFCDPNTANRIGTFLVDNGDIFKKHYACYILDQRYSAGVLTNIKLKLQSRTQEVINL